MSLTLNDTRAKACARNWNATQRIGTPVRWRMFRFGSYSESYTTSEAYVAGGKACLKVASRPDLDVPVSELRTLDARKFQ